MRPVCLLDRTKNLYQSDGLHFISDSLTKHGYAPSKAQPLNFEGTFRIEAIDAERCRGDGTRQAEYIDLLPEAHIKARRGILHECGKDAACHGRGDVECTRIARRLRNAVVADDTVTRAADAPCTMLCGAALSVSVRGMIVPVPVSVAVFRR